MNGARPIAGPQHGCVPQLELQQLRAAKAHVRAPPSSAAPPQLRPKLQLMRRQTKALAKLRAAQHRRSQHKAAQCRAVEPTAVYLSVDPDHQPRARACKAAAGHPCFAATRMLRLAPSPLLDVVSSSEGHPLRQLPCLQRQLHRRRWLQDRLPRRCHPRPQQHQQLPHQDHPARWFQPKGRAERAMEIEQACLPKTPRDKKPSSLVACCPRPRGLEVTSSSEHLRREPPNAMHRELVLMMLPGEQLARERHQ